MTYVAVAQPSREARLAAAGARGDALARARPDLRSAVDLQERLIHALVDVSDHFDRGPLPRLSLPPRYLGAKLRSGVPALTAEPIPVPVATLTPCLLHLCQELEAGGAGEAAEHIRTAVEESRIDAGSLLSASLSRDQHAIRTGATHLGLAPDLLWLVAELAVSPFAHALQRALLQRTGEPSLEEALARWVYGFCPACGSWPALAEAVSGRRVLRCSFCAAAWDLPAGACAQCAASGEEFDTEAPAADRPSHHLELCRRCRSYLKVVEVPALSPFPLLAITDLETMDLDVAAMRREFHRPMLRGFKPAGSSPS